MRKLPFLVVFIVFFTLFLSSCSGPNRVQYLEDAKNQGDPQTAEVEWSWEYEESMGQTNLDLGLRILGPQQEVLSLTPLSQGPLIYITLISQNLQTFQRIPLTELQNVNFKGLTPGNYHLFADFKPQGQRAQRQHSTLTLSGSSLTNPRPLENTWIFRDDRSLVELIPTPGEPQKNREVELSFTLKDSQNQPLKDSLTFTEGQNILGFLIPSSPSITAQSLINLPSPVQSEPGVFNLKFVPLESGWNRIWILYTWQNKTTKADFWLEVK